MDPFTKLPLELQLMIVDELEYFGELVSFSHASSFIFRTLHDCKRKASLRILRQAGPAYLLNDAVTLAEFPSRSPGVLPEEHDARVWDYMHRWKKSAEEVAPIDLDTMDPSLAIRAATICHQFQVQLHTDMGMKMTGILPKRHDPPTDEDVGSLAFFIPHCASPNCKCLRVCQRLEPYFQRGLLDKADQNLSSQQGVIDLHKWWLSDVLSEGFFKRRRRAWAPTSSEIKEDY